MLPLHALRMDTAHAVVRIYIQPTTHRNDLEDKSDKVAVESRQKSSKTGTKRDEQHGPCRTEAPPKVTRITLRTRPARSFVVQIAAAHDVHRRPSSCCHCKVSERLLGETRR